MDDEERCEDRPCLVVTYLKVENSIDQEHDKKKICLFFQDSIEVLAGQSKVRTEEERVF